MAQTTLQTFLREFYENYNLLKELEAKYDDIVAPVYLLNQLRDYEIAIERPTQALKEGLSLDDLQAKFNTLNLELRDRGLIVMTMRADFYDRVATYPNVAKVITHHQKLVERMNEKELREG